MRDKIIKILKSANIHNIDNLIDNLDKNGYFTAPGSTKYHGNYDGGLADHSYNVYCQMMYLKKIQCKINKDLEVDLPDESVIITSLLHDVCKCDNYKKDVRWRKDSKNKWEQYETYVHDDESKPFGHGEKSVIRLLKWGLDLTEDEMLAIRWHMGGFDVSTYTDSVKSLNKAMDRPLVLLLQCADTLASRLMDKTVKV
jgi:hypothetical protein